MKIISLLFVGILLISCSDLKKPEQLKKASEMLSDLTTFEKKLKDAAIDSTLENHVMEDSLIFKLKQFEQDTITVDMAKKMNRFKRLHETLPIARELQQQIFESIVAMKEDLEALKKDISEGNGRRDRYDDYLNKEQEKIDIVRKEWEQCLVLLKDINNHWDASVMEMQQLIDERISAKEVH